MFGSDVKVEKGADGGKVFIDNNGKNGTTMVSVDAQGMVQSIAVTTQAEAGTLERLRTNLQGNLSGQGPEIVPTAGTKIFSNQDQSLTACKIQELMVRPEHSDLVKALSKAGVVGHKENVTKAGVEIGDTTYIDKFGKKPDQACGRVSV